MPNDNNFTPANFNPILQKYDGIPYLRFWCQKVLPAVYDQSLSYYEVLCKLAAFLNKMLEELEKVQANVDELHKAYQELQEWVNNEIKRFEDHMEQHFDDLTQELWQKFEQYKNDTNNTLQQWFSEYETNTTNNLNKKFEEFVTNANTRIDNMFNTYVTNTNSDFNTWKNEFTNQYNEWKEDVEGQITTINSNINSLTARVTTLENMIKTYPKFDYKSFTLTGTKYYKKAILDMLSFPSSADSSVICYGVMRVYGQDTSLTVSGNWRERLVTPNNFKRDVATLLGATTQNTFKFELMPRTSYVSASGDDNNGAPTNDKLITGLLWAPGPGDNSGFGSAQLFFKNNGSVGYVSDNSMLFSALASQQANPPSWGHESGEWSV